MKQHNPFSRLAAPTLLALCLAGSTPSVQAQRAATPQLDRGLVAVKTSNGVFCSWRIPGSEYYDVQYNIYRNGSKLNSTPLNVSNYTDPSGSSSSTYTVKAVVRGVEESSASAAASVWANNYLEITPDHGSLPYTFEPNDATIADLDGDGQMELIVKFVNTDLHASSSIKTASFQAFDIIEAYNLAGNKLWWIDCGPNMIDFQSNEINIAAFDWDQDGRAECIMRAADGTVIHHSDGSTTTIGDPSKDYRSCLAVDASGYQSASTFIYEGDEFLIYMDGLTSKLYKHSTEYEANKTPYPLKRLESGETDLKSAWGDGYGHRSSKHFFGAPYLDGRNPSVFLARGIYTRHKMIALDVDPATHTLSTRWNWVCNTPGVWYGQGYHNYTVADVDIDGRDEIVFGSMVIDDCGKGLSSTGLGHGDAHHVSDFNPYVPGLEFFACNEDEPNNNYRDATTSKIYYRSVGSTDDGRACAGNFCNDHYGAMAMSGHDTPISCVTNNHAGFSSIGVNFRIYWDGDLQEELFDNTTVTKYGQSNALITFSGALSNNSTKATPCLQADIFGDWREEVIERTAAGNIRIFTTTTPTEWRNYTLLDDHQYRNAMITQMNGYNQPPHVSYFLGELEQITVAPPPLIMAGRSELKAGETLSTSLDDKHVIIAETQDATFTIGANAKPYILTVNTPTWVQGTNGSNSATDNKVINTTTYTHTLTGAALSGDMRLVKQGSGKLILNNETHTYTGNTNVWEGTLQTDATLSASPLWLNRHTSLVSGGSFNSITAEYNATISVGTSSADPATLTASNVTLNFGSRLALQLFSNGKADCLSAKSINAVVNTASIKDELTYSKPIIDISTTLLSDSETLPEGKYLIAQCTEGSLSVDNFTLVATQDYKITLVTDDTNKKLYANLEHLRDPQTIYWRGSASSNVWDFNNTANFVDQDGNPIGFVSGDNVIFDDNAVAESIVVSQVLTPGSITFANATKSLSLSGDSLVGNPALLINGGGNVSIQNDNLIGSTSITNGSTLTVSKLAYNQGNECGPLGNLESSIEISNATLAISGAVGCSQPINMASNGATILVNSGSTLSMTVAITTPSKSTQWYKTGAGTLNLAAVSNGGELHAVAGIVTSGDAGSGALGTPVTVVFEGGTFNDADNEYSYSSSAMKVVVPEGQKGTWSLDGRCSYSGSLTGAGSLTVANHNIRSTMSGDWSTFSGSLTITESKTGSYTPLLQLKSTKGLPNAKVINNAAVSNEGSSMTLGQVTGSGSLSGSGTYSIGSLGTDFEFTNTLSGCGLKKVGSGTMTITKTQAVTADVTIEAGTLNLRTSTIEDYPIFRASTSNTYGITIKSGATLSGRANVGKLTVSGGTIAPGDTRIAVMQGYLLASEVNMNNSSSLNLCLVNAKNLDSSRSWLKVNGLFGLCGTINVTLASTYKPASGDEFTLWTCNSFVLPEGNPTLNLPELPAGLQWDTSSLFAKTGILRITGTALAIPTIQPQDQVEATLYDLSGRPVATFQSTKAQAQNHARKASPRPGLYILTLKSPTQTESQRLIIK